MGLIGIYTTNRCNLSCKYCFASVEDAEINANKVCEFVRFYLQNSEEKEDNLLFTGGEPLLHNGLRYMISVLKESANEIAVLTNGALLNEDWLSFFDKNKVALHISLDSTGEKYHNMYRGQFNKIISNLEIIKNYNIKVTICMTISYENIEEVERMINYTNKMGFMLDLNLISLPETDKLSWINASENQIHDAKIQIENWSIYAKRKVKGRIMINVLKKPCLNLPICFNMKHSIIIYPDGNVYPCFMNKEMNYGNIYRDSYKHIVENKDLRKKTHLECFSISCLGIFY